MPLAVMRNRGSRATSPDRNTCASLIIAILLARPGGPSAVPPGAARCRPLTSTITAGDGGGHAEPGSVDSGANAARLWTGRREKAGAHSPNRLPPPPAPQADT